MVACNAISLFAFQAHWWWQRKLQVQKTVIHHSGALTWSLSGISTSLDLLGLACCTGGRITIRRTVKIYLGRHCSCHVDRSTCLHQKEKKTVTQKQLPVTASPHHHCPCGALTPFNIYVSLSRCWERESIRLCQDFDEKLLTTHPSKFLQLEDECLEQLDKDMERWWREMNTGWREENVLYWNCVIKAQEHEQTYKCETCGIRMRDGIPRKRSESSGPRNKLVSIKSTKLAGGDGTRTQGRLMVG